MKIARFFSYIFACIGTLLLIGSMVFILWNRSGQVRILELPREALAVSDTFVQALKEGDLEAAARQMYGQPELGAAGVPEDPETALLWDAFRRSIELELTGEWTVEQSDLVRTGTLTCLDVSSVLGKLPERVQGLLDQKIAAASELTEIYDEQNQFRQELVDTLLEEALGQVLSQDGNSVSREVTLKLVKRDGSWWVLPDQNLLQILTGLA